MKERHQGPVTPQPPSSRLTRPNVAAEVGQLDVSTLREPVRLMLTKRGREVCVGKITFLGNEPIFAIAIRRQQGTTNVVSIPVIAVDLAERVGCRWFYWRHDREPRQMRRVSLAKFRDNGWLRPDGEIYIRLDMMEQVPWQHWRYAEKLLRLGVGQGMQPRREEGTP